MTHISKLPYEILLTILLAVTTKDQSSTVSNNVPMHASPLFSVCRKWRKMLLPLLYQDAIISCCKLSRTQKIKSSPRTSLRSTSQNYKWVSNIPIIAQRRAFRHVYGISLNLYGLNDFSLLCDKVTAALDFASTDWSRVKRLKISYPNSNTKDDNVVLNSDDRSKAVNVINLFLHYIPNITLFNVNLNVGNSSASLLTEILANVYARQLRLLESAASIRIVTPFLGAFVSKIDIKINPNNVPLLPHINSKSLRHLQLSDIPATFTWKYFSTGYGDKEIYFDNLEFLSLEFSKPQSYAKTNLSNMIFWTGYYKISMPKLKNVNIDNSPVNNDILFARFDIPCLHSISVHCTTQATMQIARRPFYATEDMHFSIAQAGNVSRDFYDVTNRLFGKTRRGKLTKLSIHCNVYNFDFDKAKWNTLDTLVICRPVGYNRLLEIISKLPLLSQLAIKILDFDNYNIGTHYRHTQQQSDKRVGFLHTNIRTLWISREPAENMANLFLAKTTELVLRLRFIEELRINQKILPLARSLLSYYCNPEFPHLANITVKKVD